MALAPDNPAVLTQALAVPQSLYSQLNVLPITAGNSVTFTPVTPSPVAGYAPTQGLSYEMVATVSFPSGTVLPFVQWDIYFFEFDSLTAPQTIPIEHISWVTPGGTSGLQAMYIGGHGPLRGQYMQVNATCLDASRTAQVSLQILGTSRTYTRDVWTQLNTSFVTVPSFTLAGIVNGTLISGTINNATIAAGTSLTRLLPIWAGQVWYDILEAGVAAKMNYSIQPIPAPPFAATPNLLDIDNAGGAGSPNTGTFIAPRAPLLFTAANGGTVTATLNAYFTQLETAG